MISNLTTLVIFRKCKALNQPNYPNLVLRSWLKVVGTTLPATQCNAWVGESGHLFLN